MDQTSDTEVDKNVKLIEINNLNTDNFVIFSCLYLAL